MKKNKVKQGEIEEIFNHWNSCKICVHRFMNQNMERTIKKLLEVYPVDYVKDMISTYAEILHSDEYILTYKWGVDDFCGGRFSSFLPEKDPRAKYIKTRFFRGAGKQTPPALSAFPPPAFKTKRVQQWMAASKEEREKLRKQWEEEKSENKGCDMDEGL